MSEHDDVEDIEACVREGRRPRDAGPYRVLIGDGLFRFHPVIIDEAALTGRSLCEKAALTPPERHVLFAVQSDGLLEEIRLEEQKPVKVEEPIHRTEPTQTVEPPLAPIEPHHEAVGVGASGKVDKSA